MFQPGISGNPAGRPTGSVNKSLKALREAAERVLPLVLERALSGDFDAQKLILERGMPRMKSVAPAEEFNLPVGSLSYQIQSLIEQVAAGELSSTAASQAILLLGTADKAREIEIQSDQTSAALRPKAMYGNPYLTALRARISLPERTNEEG